MKSQLFSNIHQEVKDLWWHTSSIFEAKSAFSINAKSNDKKMLQFIEHMQHAMTGIKNFSLDDKQRKTLTIKASVFLMDTMNINPEYIDLLAQKMDLYHITEQFVKRAGQLVPGIKTEDLFQALRNVWVMNFLQLYLGQEVCLTDAAFGYSMLYPLTDNYIDDDTVSHQDKKRFHAWLESRLSGLNCSPFNENEKHISDMIGLIENQYPRAEYKSLYQALMAIYQAQRDSLKQQEADNIFDTPILDLTFYKGGTSVLADAYLCKGHLTEQEQKMAYTYGVILQMADDLQDVTVDLLHHHSTIMNIQARYGTLDLLMNQYLNFIHNFLRDLFMEDTIERKALKEVLYAGVKMLIDHAVVRNEIYFSRNGYKNCVKKMYFSAMTLFKVERKLKSIIYYKHTPSLVLLEALSVKDRIRTILAAKYGMFRGRRRLKAS